MQQNKGRALAPEGMHPPLHHREKCSNRLVSEEWMQFRHYLRCLATRPNNLIAPGNRVGMLASILNAGARGHFDLKGDAQQAVL